MLLDRLRAATQPDHQALEKDLDLLRPCLTRGRYAWVLERFFGFWAPWEEHAGAVLDPAFFSPRRKAAWLARDLEALGCPIAALPYCTRLPALRSLSETLGSMYVLEGSTLGGQLLARHVEKELGIRSTFFFGYGEATGAMWRAFRQELTSRAAGASEEVVVDSARSTFRSIHEWVCEAPIG